MNRLRLDHKSQAMRRALTEALADLPDKPRGLVSMKCADCGKALGAIGPSKIGPLFLSWWDVERDPPGRAVVNGRALNRREYLAYLETRWPLESESGRPETYVDRHGSCAILYPPDDEIDDIPCLVVRCQDHGDAEVALEHARQWARAGVTPVKVQTTHPRLAYEPPVPGLGRPSTSRQVRRWRPSSGVPMDQMRQMLGWDDSP